jgi:group I intron endonuclease
MAREKICGIYRITSAVHPDRIYIGSTTDYHDRVRRHLNQLKLKTHHNLKLQCHVDKYGIEDFSFELIKKIEFTTLAFLLEREQYYLDTLNPYLNIDVIAGSSLGVKRSEETKRKVGDASRGHKMPDHVKELLVSINTGSHITEEHKEAIRRAQSKPKPYMVERNKGNKYGQGNRGKKKSVPSPLKGKKTGRVPKSAFKKGDEPWNKGEKVRYIPHPKQSESMKNYWARRKEAEQLSQNDKEEKGTGAGSN